MAIKIPGIVAAFLAFGLLSCDSKKEDVTDSVNKAGSVETSVEIKHLDENNDILITRHKVWAKHNLYKSIEYWDTVPGLGQMNTTAENSEGDTRTVTVPREYEIFITVK